MTHADTGCLNMILVQGSLKIIDFEGAPFVLESYDSI
jgi:thiamine kinase-like enzyme